MGMPSGDSPAKAHQYYEYLQSHQQTFQAPATWHVHWLDLAWLWGFLLALAVIILWWLGQYRSTRQRGIYPADEFGGYTTGAPSANVPSGPAGSASISMNVDAEVATGVAATGLATVGDG